MEDHGSWLQDIARYSTITATPTGQAIPSERLTRGWRCLHPSLAQVIPTIGSFSLTGCGRSILSTSLDASPQNSRT